MVIPTSVQSVLRLNGSAPLATTTSAGGMPQIFLNGVAGLDVHPSTGQTMANNPNNTLAQLYGGLHGMGALGPPYIAAGPPVQSAKGKIKKIV